MIAFSILKESSLSLDEKIKLLDKYDVQDLRDTLKDFDNNPHHYEKEVIIAVINKLFDLGVTSI